MTWSSKTRGWKAFAVLAAVAALLLLLLPHAPNHHPAALLFLLVPIFVFLEPVPAGVTYSPHKNHSFVLSSHVRYTLFQRPPPAQA
jgi:hypothetical protein